jgi:hypothetical protein
MCWYEKGSWYFYCFYGLCCRYSMRAEFINGILNSTTIFLFVLIQVLAPELFFP